MTRKEKKELLLVAIANRDAELISYWSNELKAENEKDKDKSKGWLEKIREGRK